MSQRFWDKFGFQRLQQNQVFMRLPHDVKGVFMELRILAGNCDAADGSIPLGAAKRAKEEDVLDYLTYGDKSLRNIFKKALGRLVTAGVITVTTSGTVKIAGYEEEQGLARTSEGDRKRDEAKAKFQENVNAAGAYLKKVFVRSKAESLPYEVMHASIRNHTRCINRTADNLLRGMIDAGLLLSVGDDSSFALASLGSPPESGSGTETGTGHEFPVRKIPEEKYTQKDPEKEGTTVPSVGPTGACARSRSASQATSTPGVGGGLPSEARGFSEGIPCSPEDAWQVQDPLQAVEAFLREKPGWSEKQEGDKPPSQFPIRGKWRDLRKAVGPQAATKIWRQALFDILSDHCDKQTWNSWTAGFLTKLKVGQACFESLNGGAE